MSKKEKEPKAPKEPKPEKAPKPEAKPKRPVLVKNNTVLGELAVEYLPTDSVKPNQYNPNRQSPHDFELLCKSIAEDGFTQPIVVQKNTREIVDGEHRWRACKALGYTEVPCVLTEMSPEQMRIATLRHNRARGSEDANMAADVMRELRDMGALEHAQDSLQLDDVEVQRLLEEMPEAEAPQIEANVPDSMLGPKGQGLSALDQGSMTDQTADRLRAKEKLLATAKNEEERTMLAKDMAVYRLVLFFTGDEAKLVKAAFDPNPAQKVLDACREIQAGG